LIEGELDYITTEKKSLLFGNRRGMPGVRIREALNIKSRWASLPFRKGVTNRAPEKRHCPIRTLAVKLLSEEVIPA